jgi:ATPase subunit of ABC transporter with duplicated ATPase domains
LREINEALDRRSGVSTETTVATLPVAHVTNTFPSPRALDDVSLEIGPRSIHALVGPNGCGTSTLVKALAGHHRPDPREELPYIETGRLPRRVLKSERSEVFGS